MAVQSCGVAAFDLLYSITSMKQVTRITILKSNGLVCKLFFMVKHLVG